MGCNRLNNVTLLNGVVIIYESAFENCNRINYITLPTSIKLIRSFAFQNCRQLSSVSLSINSNLSEIYGGSFIGCDYLTKINLDPNDSKFRFTNGALTTFAEDVLITFIPSSPITTFVVPQEMITINNYAFLECRNLRRILFNGNKIKYISISAFSGCRRLEFLFFASNSLVSIGDGSFDDCRYLNRCVSISCPQDVKERCFSKFGFAESVFSQICPEEEIKTCIIHECSYSNLYIVIPALL